MFRHFESAIRPLLDVTKLSTVIEVGAEDGKHTFKLMPYIRSRQAHLHIIDPVPKFDVARFGNYATLHPGLSLDVLPSIDEPDVVLLDGDHNWYTVREELRILDRICADWPLTFAHDIEFPYGRRDMYYAPERVPDDCRQPYAQLGLVRDRSELVRYGGMNPELANATHEGGPRNGVLTGIEDFLDETQRNLVLFTVPENAGLGIIVDRARLYKRRFAKVLRRVHDPRAAMALSPSHASTRAVVVPSGTA
jgi:hypothetical protein